MTIPKPSSRAAVSCVGVAMLFLAVLSVGCSGMAKLLHQQSQRERQWLGPSVSGPVGTSKTW